MQRRGLGIGLGKGYYNLVPKDPYIHSLSAKGVKTKQDPSKKLSFLSNKYFLIKEIEDKGIYLDSYPTDTFNGSNTGEADLYYFNGNFYEINRERDGNRVIVGKISEDLEKELFKKYKSLIPI